MFEEGACAMSTIRPIEASARRMARLAGLSYVIYTLAGLYITFGPIPPLSGFPAEPAASAMLEFQFRTGFLAEAVMYTFVVVSAASMYAVLKSVSQGGALVGAFCRLIEAALGATFAAVAHPELTPGFSGEERASLMTFLRDVYSSGIYILMIPMAFGGVIFFSLFFRSRWIPRWLAGWGVLTYLVLGGLGASIILFPDLEQHVMLFFIPGALFEWVVALWLLLAGINAPAQADQRTATS